jgi:hypothetical protein
MILLYTRTGVRQMTYRAVLITFGLLRAELGYIYSLYLQLVYVLLLFGAIAMFGQSSNDASRKLGSSNCSSTSAS